MSCDAEVIPAVFWRRFTARVLDDAIALVLMGAIVCAAGGLIALVALLGIGDEFMTSEHSALDTLAILLYAALLALGLLGSLTVYCLYTVYAARRTGQTMAKRWLGVRVVSCISGPLLAVSMNRLLRRSSVLHVPAVAFSIYGAFILREGLSLYLSFALAYTAVVAASTLLSRSRRGLHDWAAGTVVIAEQPTRWWPRRNGNDGMPVGGQIGECRGHARYGHSEALVDGRHIHHANYAATAHASVWIGRPSGDRMMKQRGDLKCIGG